LKVQSSAFALFLAFRRYSVPAPSIVPAFFQNILARMTDEGFPVFDQLQNERAGLIFLHTFSKNNFNELVCHS